MKWKNSDTRKDAPNISQDWPEYQILDRKKRFLFKMSNLTNIYGFKKKMHLKNLLSTHGTVVRIGRYLPNFSL